MPPTSWWAGGRPTILVLGADEAADDVREVLSPRADVRAGATGSLVEGEVAEADLVVVVVGDDPDPANHVAELRAETNSPIVVVSGPGPDRFSVFAAGADDVAAAPVDPEELTARVSARLARCAAHRVDQIHHGDLVIDGARRVVTLRGEAVALTPREFDLLEHLARHPHRAFTREELLESVWRSSVEWQQARTVNEHVHRLRRKLGEGWVQTVHGVGYRFEPLPPAPT
jgi:DNA-binding response OmpR family regulator